jgi:glycolate oxidase FAD binding subunit
VDLTRWSIDGVAPTRVERPATDGEVASLIGAAHRAHEAVVLWGGATRIAVGEAPSRYDTALDLTGLGGIVEHSPADLVCTVRAGTTIAALQAELARAGQRWPVEVAYPERATVGGTIASSAPGPSRLRHQHLRDWILGCTAVLGDGTLVRAGGRVVKNVTGYDLTRLYSGSYGTLAALVEVSLKLIALDEGTRTLVLRDPDARRLASIGAELRAALPVDALALVTVPDPRLYVRVAGTSAAVERLTAEVRARGAFEERPGDELLEIAKLPSLGAKVARLAVTPGREWEDLDGLALAYLGTGVAFRFEATVDELRGLRARVERGGGALVVERAPADEKRAVGVWGRTGTPVRIARALKDRFDPHGVLAPGRMPV